MPLDRLNTEAQNSLDELLHLKTVRRDILKLKNATGQGKAGPKEVTGANDAQKLASLITALEELGLITTP